MLKIKYNKTTKRGLHNMIPNEYVYNEEQNCYNLIITTKTGDKYISLIDAEIVDDCKEYQWHIYNQGEEKIYVGCLINNKLYFLHRLICDNLNTIVDHINGNSLDNRKSNLRKCTQKQNAQNTKKTKSLEGVTGVRKDIRCKNSYRAQIYLSSSQHIERTFKDKDLAIIQRLCWELMYFQDFAPQIELIKEQYPYLLGYQKLKGKMVFNSDMEMIKSIGDCLKKNPHCPCMLKQNDNTICPCLPCRSTQHCCCQLFVPIEVDESPLKTKYPDIYTKWLDEITKIEVEG